MYGRVVSAVGAAALLAGMVTTSASGTSPHGSCYRQMHDGDGVGIVSQNFEQELNIYDARAADDFTLHASCQVTGVQVRGSYSLGAGPADSMRVTFYRDRGGDVGGVVRTTGDLRYRDTSGLGDITMTLARPVNLPAGRYWISVRANMDFSQGGQWGWNTNSRKIGYRSQWTNPNDGFGTGCTTYTDTVTCIPSGEGPDFAFALLT